METDIADEGTYEDKYLIIQNYWNRGIICSYPLVLVVKDYKDIL